MEEEGDNRIRNPSLPPNYLTLVQLQERWIKEQQQKQRLKAEEEARKQREKEKEEEKDRMRKERLQEERKRDDRQNERRRGGNGQTSNRRSFRGNRHNRSERSCRTSRLSEQKPREALIGAIVVADGNEEQKVEDSKELEKGKRKNKGKARAEEDLAGGKGRLLSLVSEEKKIPVDLTGIDCENEGINSDFQRKGENLGVTGRVWARKVKMDQSAEIGRKFQGLSLSGGRGGNERYARNKDGGGRGGGGEGRWRHNWDSGRYHHRRMQKPRDSKDSNLVWVRKGDASDFAGVSS